MALIKCPECGKDVSSSADVCIHCGYPLMQKRITEKKDEDKGVVQIASETIATTSSHEPNLDVIQNGTPRTSSKGMPKGCLVSVVIWSILFLILFISCVASSSGGSTSIKTSSNSPGSSSNYSGSSKTSSNSSGSSKSSSYSGSSNTTTNSSGRLNDKEFDAYYYAQKYIKSNYYSDASFNVFDITVSLGSDNTATVSGKFTHDGEIHKFSISMIMETDSASITSCTVN